MTHDDFYDTLQLRSVYRERKKPKSYSYFSAGNSIVSLQLKFVIYCLKRKTTYTRTHVEEYKKKRKASPLNRGLHTNYWFDGSATKYCLANRLNSLLILSPCF